MSHEIHTPVVIKTDQLVLTEHTYSIGQLSAMFGLSLRAIRFYCESGLIRASDYRHGRMFDRRNVLRLALVQIGKDLGFTLREIATMLREGEAANGQPYLEISSERVDAEIALLNKQRSVMTERLKWLTACKKTPAPNFEMSALSA